jgi:hypothetical protein
MNVSKPFRVIASGSLLAIVTLLFAASVGSGQSRGSAVIRECANGPQCLPKTASVLVLRVVDAEESGIGNVPVEIIRADPGTAAGETLARWRTSKDGVAAGALLVDEHYGIRINMPGYFPFESKPRSAAGATTAVVTVQLRVPPIVD